MAEAQIKLGYIVEPFAQIENTNGKPVVGGHIEVYEAGTNVKYITYQNFDFTQNPFKIPLGSDGRAIVLGDCDLSYDVYIYDSFNNLIVSRLNVAAGDAGGVAGGGLREVIHDETMTGKGTQLSPLGVSPLTNLAVDETMTAYEATVEGKDSLVLGVNGDWFYNQFGSAFSGKVDWSAFNSAYYGLKGAISSKADWSALNNYFTKNETYNNFLPRSAIDLNNYYTKNEVFNKSEINTILGFKEDKLDFGYNDSSAISSINGSALAGSEGGDSCPWISGTKVIADTQTLTSNMIIQVLSSFTMSGDHNHFIGMKGGTYRFPNEYEIGSALLHTNYFMHLSGMSGYLPISSFSSYTASIANNLENNWNYTNSAYGLSINNFYNKLDASAFSSYSANQDSTINNITEQITNISGDLSSYATKTYVDSKDPVLIGDSNVTATSSKVDNHTQWNLAVNGTPIVTDTKLVGDNCVTAHTTETSGEWIVGLVQSAYEAIDSIDGISSDVDTLKNASGNYYPMTGNPSGFINDLSNYYQKNETSSKGEISDAIASIPQGDPGVNNFVQTNSSTIVDVDNVVQANSAQWAENTGDIQVNNYVYNNSGINNEVNNVVTANSGVWNDVTNKLDTTAFTAWSSTIFSGDYELSAGNGIALVDDVQNKITRIDFTGTSGPDLSAGEGIGISTIDGKTIISNNISAGQGVSLVYDVETNTYRIDGEGREYSGVAPIQVNNSTNQISITGESLSAGPGIDIFSSGGYVVISSYGGNTPTTYCYVYPSGYGEFDLDTMTAYNKVTIFAPGDYSPDRMLYGTDDNLNHSQKVMPSGLWVEALKNRKEGGQFSWSLINSGWISFNNMWEGD